jgi:hypothetical protein
MAVDELEGLGEVLGEVAPGGRGVPGHGEAGQAGQRHVGGPADAGLEHPAAPQAGPALPAHLVDLQGFDQPPDPAELEVDDAAGPVVERVGGVVGVLERLIEAHRSAPARSVPGVGAQPARREGLLDQLHAELVERVQRPQVPGIVGVVGGVGVDLQREVAELLAHGGQRLDVAARRDLDLDPQVALVEVGGHLLEQRRGAAVGDPDRHAGRHAVSHPAQRLGQPDPAGAQLCVGDGDLEGGPSHLVAPDAAQPPGNLLPGHLAAVGEQRRHQVSAQHLGGAVGVLRRVHRRGGGDALAPPLGLVGEHVDQQRVALVLHPE